MKLIKLVGLLAGVSLVGMLAACGGSSSSVVVDNTSTEGLCPGGAGPAAGIVFTSGTLVGSGNVLTLALSDTESNDNCLVFDLIITGVDPNLDLANNVTGIAADVTLNATALTLAGVKFHTANTSEGSPNAANAVAVDANNANGLVIALTDVREGLLARISFTASTGTSAISFASQALVGSGGAIVADQPMATRGGSITIP